jgi:hypothetical protein
MRWANRRDHSVCGGAVMTTDVPERTRNVEIDAYRSFDIPRLFNALSVVRYSKAFDSQFLITFVFGRLLFSEHVLVHGFRMD